MMTPVAFLKLIIDPTLQWLQPLVAIPFSDQARVMLLAIAGQESDWMARLQSGDGPARGYWQFEGEGGGVSELFTATPRQLLLVCDELAVPYDPDTVYELVAWNDTLACSMARLLLWQDPAALPTVGDQDGSFEYYFRNWRPKLRNTARWASRYAQAIGAVRSVR